MALMDVVLREIGHGPRSERPAKALTEYQKTGAHRLPLLLNPPTGLHVRDNRVAKL
jgi:hypothetical protein